MAVYDQASIDHRAEFIAEHEKFIQKAKIDLSLALAAASKDRERFK